MLKSELIKQLQELPDDAEVSFYAPEYEHADSKRVNVSKICQVCPDGPDYEEPYILLQ